MALSRSVLSVLLVVCGTFVVNCENNYGLGFRRDAYDDYADKEKMNRNDFAPAPSQNKIDDYYINWGRDGVRKDDLTQTPSPWNRFDNSFRPWNSFDNQDRNEDTWDDPMQAREVRIFIPPAAMQAAMFAAVCLSVVLTLVLAVVLVKSICSLLRVLGECCKPVGTRAQRVFLKPAAFANHGENIHKKMSSPEKEELIGGNAPNDRTQLKKDFVAYYSC